MKNIWDTVEDNQNYTPEELALLDSTYRVMYEEFSQFNSRRLLISKALQHPNHSDIISFLNAVCFEHLMYASGANYLIIRKLMYELPLDQMPLYLHESLALWRLAIGR